ncbi:MAG: DNA-3-methyladenine glycosylase family protein [Vulcanimicrobiaceae bacterium]
MTARAKENRTQATIDVAIPYRLDLTVSVLRRLSANVVDTLTSDGRYLRAFAGPGGPLFVRVAQERPDALEVALEGPRSEHAQALALVRRMLGVDRELAQFERAARRIGWLAPLATRMRGVKPPRYPTLWEACVNAIVFQQVSIHAASAILRRFVVHLSAPLQSDGVVLHPFPAVERFARADDGPLAAAGLSAAKIATLRRVATALCSGSLVESELEGLPSPDAAERLCQMKGIGPWTATVILLRGLGRLDVFPMNDSGVARALAAVSGRAALDVDRLLSALGSQRGMLYYHLLLARLEERGELGRASQY